MFVCVAVGNACVSAAAVLVWLMMVALTLGSCSVCVGGVVFFLFI